MRLPPMLGRWAGREQRVAVAYGSDPGALPIVRKAVSSTGTQRDFETLRVELPQRAVRRWLGSSLTVSALILAGVGGF